MFWFIVILAAGAVGAWFVFPDFRAFIDGWKTRIVTWSGSLMAIVQAVDPTLLSKAMALDAKGIAIVTVVLFVLAALFREMAKKAGVLGK